MRREKDFVVPTPAPPKAGEEAKKNRDAGKVFVIREMSAMRAEAWATRMWLALSKGNVQVPQEALASGWAGLATLGAAVLINGATHMNYSDLEPLWAEMLGCVSIRPDPRNPQVVRPIVEDDIEEVSTILLLRSEVVEIHTGFSIAGALSRGLAAAKTDQPS